MADPKKVSEVSPAVLQEFRDAREARLDAAVLRVETAKAELRQAMAAERALRLARAKGAPDPRQGDLV